MNRHALLYSMHRLWFYCYFYILQFITDFRTRSDNNDVNGGGFQRLCFAVSVYFCGGFLIIKTSPAVSLLFLRLTIIINIFIKHYESHNRHHNNTCRLTAAAALHAFCPENNVISRRISSRLILQYNNIYYLLLLILRLLGAVDLAARVLRLYVFI